VAGGVWVDVGKAGDDFSAEHGCVRGALGVCGAVWGRVDQCRGEFGGGCGDFGAANSVADHEDA